MYATLLWRHQSKLSVHDPITIDLGQLCSSSKEREKIMHSVSNFFAGEHTVGHGITARTFVMLQDIAQTRHFMEWLEEEKHTHHAAAAKLLPQLEEYTKAKADAWEVLSHHHVLSFLLGSYSQRVYWFEVVEVFRRLMLRRVDFVRPRDGGWSLARLHACTHMHRHASTHVHGHTPIHTHAMIQTRAFTLM